MGRKLGPLEVTEYSRQYRRRVISDSWRPAGYNRQAYRDMAVEQNAMPVLGGPDDQLGVNPDRYRKIGCLEDGFQ
jgi:hypothetical protein